MSDNQPSKFLPTLLAIAVFMQMLDATILNTALPKIATDLHESPLNMQSTIIAYALTLAVFMPLSGYLSDRFGTRKVFIVAMGLFTLGSLLSASSTSLMMLVGARIVQGLGGSMLMPVPRLVVMRAYPKDRLLSVMNYIVTPALIGPVLGPLVGGYLVDYASWHWIFLINIPIGLLAIFIAFKVMPDFHAPDKSTLHLDKLGFFLFIGGAVGLTLAVENITRANGAPLAGISFVLGVACLIGYLQHAKRDKNALYAPNLFQVRTYRLGQLGSLVSRLGMSAVPFLLPLLLQLAFHRSAAVSGWLLAPIALAAMLGKMTVESIIQHVGYRRVLIINTRIIGLLIMMLAIPTINTPLWLLLPLLFALGVCNSIQFTAMNTLALADLRDWQMGSGNSLLSVNQQLSISFGIAIGALLLNLFSKNHILTETLHGAFCETFIVIGTITFASSWIFTRLHKSDGDNLMHKD